MNQVHPSISELTLAATPNAVAWARRHTVDILQRWRFPPDGTEVARLLISELATNAIPHARPTETSETATAESAGPGTIVVRLWPTEGGIVLAVSAPAPQPPVPRADDASATGGRGLLLVQAMATRWGYYQPRPRSGKTVWAEVPPRPKPGLGGPDAGGHRAAPILIGRVLTGLREL
ncbi:ATP-binding protein [Streptomyces sp. CC228A]|uniref:ATP-binding protein n=1 Tax=Streptomyces sp. CC228A TaxID=2898186 RepID=UPI001F3CCB34|nr:ATP-binding protein [Streptomyces sp. CC228A]